MPTKHHRTAARRPVTDADADAAALLARVIEALEQDRPREAVLLLLDQGPAFCQDVLRQEREQPAMFPFDTGAVPETSIVGGELLAFLRGIVRLEGTGLVAQIWMHGFDLRAYAAAGRVQLEPVGPIQTKMRTAAIFQFALLLQTVGIGNVRRCTAPDCPRLYVKHYRREFCSPRCQRRVYMRAQRLAPTMKARRRGARKVKAR